MTLRRLVFVSALVLAVTALGPAAAQGAAKGPDRPLRGAGTSTAIINLATGTGAVDGAGYLTHLGWYTAHTDDTSFTLTGNTFVIAGTATFVAPNGDKIFTTVATNGTVTATGSVSTSVNTITGGAGRFADATGTLTVTDVGVTVSVVGSVVTSKGTDTEAGHISYGHQHCRPFIGSGSGIDTVPVLGGSTFLVDGTVHTSPLGTGTFHSQGTQTGPTSFTFVTSGVYAGGTLTSSASGTNTTANTATSINTITGGTRRLTGAAGSSVITSTSAPTSNPQVSTLTFTFTGTICLASHNVDRR
jgi:hypothetical protein